ncbi:MULTISPECIES: hypothetical protein [unclassified Lysobacter]|uniref:hypothetical protein n=1 Tax=unclassified Lysobacter TaxID=2635362 RepID=UPI001BEC13ED|nr:MULTISPECIES: hypothetical protein [unclassified Lysobacter]MBT2749072.1 hypothetical protein [Lysobacter sp. ISL-42]MBT2751386.1 hypothetical protein [Lysobacter sp. ISL-50]MBT2777328.1 hypothetical protein [Lysobacter sp. ISL-54]MBT2781596.1 hypothetical protein [Lysobacter sp. ISL-52]
MALDLIQARHEREIHTSRKMFAIDEMLHSQLLARAQPRGEYPLLHKLHDYYADTVLLLGELPRLQAELTRIRGKFTDPTQVHEFSRFVEQALADGDNLYATAD